MKHWQRLDNWNRALVGLIVLVSLFACMMWGVVGYSLLQPKQIYSEPTATALPEQGLVTPKLELVNVVDRVSGGLVFINGTVRNDTGVGCSFVEARVVLLQDDQPVASEWSHVDDLFLEAGAESTFEVRIRYDGSWNKYRVSFRTLTGCF